MRLLCSLLTIAALLWPGAAWADGVTRYVGDAHDVIYTVTDDAGDHVTGESPTLLVRRDSDGFVYDWADATFKNSGWTTKTTALTENATDGYYFKKWTPPGSETASNSYTFVVDNANTNTYGDHQAESVAYVTKPVHPTVAGRTLDVTATGGAGIDWGNVEAPTTTLALTNTTISTSQVVGSVTGAVGSVTGSVGGNVTGTIGGLTVTALADFFDTDSGTTYGAAHAGSVVKQIADNAGGSGLTAGAIADAVWDEPLSGHATAGTAGKKLSDMPTSGVGDWSEPEKAEIKEALGIDDGTAGTNHNIPYISDKVRKLQ